MKILLPAGVILCLMLASCQKEINYALRDRNIAPQLLTKIVSKSGNDSSTMTFGYNSAKKLMSLNIVTVSSGATSVTSERVERDAQGIVTRLIIKDDQYAQLGLDSVVTVVTYANGAYTSKVTTIDLGVGLYKDSVSLIYDGEGRVIREQTFDDVGTGTYDESAKIEYTYGGYNISAINYYSFDASTSTYTLLVNYAYQAYDDHLAAATLGNEAFVFDSPEFFCVNNATHSTITAPNSPTQTYNTSYTYNNANKPTSATANVQPGDGTTTGTYYYQ